MAHSQHLFAPLFLSLIASGQEEKKKHVLLEEILFATARFLKAEKQGREEVRN